METLKDILTPREFEIAELVSRGKENNVIAEILQISPSTVKAFLKIAFAKLGIENRVCLATRFVLEEEKGFYARK